MSGTAKISTLEEFEREMYSETDIGKIHPVFKGCRRAVCLVASDEYAPFASLVLQGIIDNATRSNNYDIVILTKDMEMRNSYVLTQMASGHKNISVRVRNVKEQIKDLNFYTWAHFTIDTYLRLLIPTIFADYDRVLYLDSDVIVNHDVAELLDTDMGNNYMAATYDTHVVAYNHGTPDYSKYNTETLHMTDPDQYFQMGVCLYNIKLINKDYAPDFLIKSVAQAKLKWLDQDFINMTFYGRILPIPNKWNVMICNRFPTLDECTLPEPQRSEYAAARRDPYIIHYVGRQAPCYTLRPDLWTYFWHYARRSPYYEIILQQMALNAAHNYHIDQLSRYRIVHPGLAKLQYALYRLFSHITWGQTARAYRHKKGAIKNALRNRK